MLPKGEVMNTDQLKPGNPIEPCHNDPTLRVRSSEQNVTGTDLDQSTGYTSRGYVQHFLSDREVNLAQLNKALADVFGEPALRMMNMNLEIDREYWMQVCGNPWDGNIYQYRFRPSDRPPEEVEILREQIARLSAENEALKQGSS
jgi:hypothetical protein